MEKANEDEIRCWLEENDVSEGNISFQGNLSDTDNESEHDDCDVDTEQSGDNSPRYYTAQHVDEAIDIVQTIPINTNTVEPGPSTQKQRPIERVSASYTSKDGVTNWNVHKPQSTKRARQNIIKKLPSVKRSFRDLKEPVDCWKIFFPNDMISDIVHYTNQELQRMRPNYTRARDCNDTDFVEVQAFFGLLYLIGVKKANHLNTHELWSNDGTAPEIFAATMSERRFHTLLQAIRFDDRHTRAQRKEIDNAAPIRDIFERFVSLCKLSYNVGELVTLDEMLEGFRGRCKFRQYIPNKPAKYGLKIYALVDAKSFFTCNMELYAGKQPPGPYATANDATSVVLRMVEPIDNSGINVTMDNYFTSVPLLNDLYANHRITVVGTIRKNKPELPQELLAIKDRKRCSSMFAFGNPPNKCTIVSYIPDKKTKKNVLVASTMHDDDEIDADTDDAAKPTIITFYNMTKGGVDVVDRLKSEYSVTRISNRWPLTVFGGLLNVGAINAQIICKTNTGELKLRRLFLTDLAKILIKPHMIRRGSIETLPTELRGTIRRLTGQPALLAPAMPQEQKGRCAFCPVRKNRFTTRACSSCSQKICGEHTKKTVYMCFRCTEEPVSDSDE